MRQFTHIASAAITAGTFAAALALTPIAQAVPECVQTAPNTTMCRTNGSNAITTSPPPNQWANYGPLFWGGPGWGGGWGGGLVIGIG